MFVRTRGLDEWAYLASGSAVKALGFEDSLSSYLNMVCISNDSVVPLPQMVHMSIDESIAQWAKFSICIASLVHTRKFLKR